LAKFDYIWADHENLQHLHPLMHHLGDRFPDNTAFADLVGCELDQFHEITQALQHRLAAGQHLILTHSWETAKNYYLGVAYQLISAGMPAKDISIICCGMPRPAYIEKIRELGCNLYHLPYFLIRTYNTNNCLSVRPKKPDLVCLNRRPKFERAYMCSGLLDLGLAHRISWASKQIYFHVGPVSDYTKNQIDNSMDLENARARLSEQQFHRYADNYNWFTTPHQIAEDIYPNSNDHSTNSPVYDSLVNCISETWCDASYGHDGLHQGEGSTIFLTEKTFKAIYCKQILLLQNVPGSLAHLRDMGFRTFHDFLDENYDAEPDIVKRTDMILDQVRKIKSYDARQWQQLIEDTEEIRQHNHDHMINMVRDVMYITKLV
jgi:hypothetical protein